METKTKTKIIKNTTRVMKEVYKISEKDMNEWAKNPITKGLFDTFEEINKLNNNFDIVFGVQHVPESNKTIFHFLLDTNKN